MKLTTISTGLVTLLIPILGFSVTDLNAISFKGHKSCAVYLSNQEIDNLVIVCDGVLKTKMTYGTFEELGSAKYEAITSSYSSYAKEKCAEAGLTKVQVVETAQFWGQFCNK